MQLQQINGTSKKTGKNYTAYCVKIGEYSTPLFFPSKIELMYIKNFLKKQAHAEFKFGDEDEEELDVEDADDEEDV